MTHCTHFFQHLWPGQMVKWSTSFALVKWHWIPFSLQSCLNSFAVNLRMSVLLNSWRSSKRRFKISGFVPLVLTPRSLARATRSGLVRELFGSDGQSCSRSSSFVKSHGRPLSQSAHVVRLSALLRRSFRRSWFPLLWSDTVALQEFMLQKCFRIHQDVAMWSTLTASSMRPRGVKFLLEIFCGAAVLARLCMAAGYETCTPLDLQTGWNVFNPQHRQYAEEVLQREQPFLLTLAWPCGPCSTWQRMQPEKQVAYLRKLCIPVLRWVARMVKQQRQQGGFSLLENPWYADSWKILHGLEKGPRLHDGIGDYQVHRVDLCTYGLKDRES